MPKKRPNLSSWLENHTVAFVFTLYFGNQGHMWEISQNHFVTVILVHWLIQSHHYTLTVRSLHFRLDLGVLNCKRSQLNMVIKV